MTTNDATDLTKAEAYAAFEATDTAWQAELTRVFGKDAYVARYLKDGRGTFEDALGVAFLARDKARLIAEQFIGQQG
jgi:hypothetical protein